MSYVESEIIFIKSSEAFFFLIWATCTWIQTWVIHIRKLKYRAPEMRISISTCSQSMICSKYFHHMISIVRWGFTCNSYSSICCLFFPVKNKIKWIIYFFFCRCRLFCVCACVCVRALFLKANPHHSTISFLRLKCHHKERNQIL